MAVEEGQGLLVYTDGLIENRRQPRSSERWSEEALVEWLDRRPTASPDLDQLLATFGPRGFDDDVAVMVIHPSAIGDAR